jgi:beta-phosphoglucomutase-like phosphatase (HAD superfamily)
MGFMEELVVKIIKCISFVLLFAASSNSAIASNKSPWVYFDLGETIINSKDLKNISYITGSKEYLEQLKQNGYRIGLITNIPETWGADYPSKLAELKRVIASGWTESNEFDWSVFDEVILPLNNSELKPAPTLFLKAIQIAQSCPSLFIGDSEKEVLAASNLGMASKQFRREDPELYLPISDIANFIEQNYKLDYDLDCLRL